ncbi:MAG: serine protein kinase RIO [Nanoarchaeota archaeon]|nr:serine protein kinase RIO [Nanoarchaeota archaeon]MBU1623006.1 serine protein kinase RIO [Nanoarchaeota archaeon]MBU1974414.1 serine protein kinase RIO [Nanoarchaeota archaeon]
MTTFTYQERFRTAKGVFDEFTNRNLFKLQSEKVFDELVSPLEVGKESNVFIARKGKKKIIVKIYRVQNADFKRMYDYIRKDIRYQFLRNKRREIIFAWTQREYKNLLRAEKAKIKAPKALGWKFNILVEEFIGKEKPSLPLKDDYPRYPYQFLEDIITEMKKMYESGLIHGDLSAFNILNHNDKPVLIDFSQATLVRTPNSEELLKRDIKNILQFFKKLNIKADPKETFFKITGKKE